MDFLRSCYTGTMQFDEEGLITAQVQWYWCSDEAKYFHLPNAFCSGVWDEDPYSHVGIGETNDPKNWRDGSFPIPVTGTDKVCGDPIWFTEGCPSDAPPLPRNSSGLSTCCGPGGLVLGGHSVVTSAYQGKGVLVLGGSNTIPSTCQPWYADFPFFYSLFSETTSTYWNLIFELSSIAEFENPLISGSVIRMEQQGLVTACNGNYNTIGVLTYSPPFSGTINLNFISFNVTTSIGRWQVPLTSLQYAGQFFDFYNPPF
jgi:hypothetical protein